MNNSELGSRTQGWADVTFPFFLLGDDFGGPARLGTVCWGLLGDFKSSSLAEDHQCRFKGNNPPYLLITLKAFAMEIWAPEAGRMWLKAWLSRRWLCFQTSFMLQGKKKIACPYVCVTFPQLWYLNAPFSCCCSASLCWTSVLCEIIFKRLFS